MRGEELHLRRRFGCGDGKLTAALQSSDRCIVQGLDAEVTAARRHIQSLGLYGKMTAEPWTGDSLPYVDKLVNLVVADSLGGLPMEEVLRVLAPNGVAWIGGKKTVKPRPQQMDEYQLDAAPVRDSMAVAGGRLYIATQDGRLRCFEEER